MSSSDSDDFEAFCNASNVENLTEAQYINCRLGEKYLPLTFAVPCTLLYVAIFVSGVVGNLLTCTVIVRNPSMHTPTDYYLFNLAISDLTLLILGLPNEVTLFWQQYPWLYGVVLCKTRAYVSEMSSYVSVLTIVTLSMERYLAICHPLRVYQMSAMERPRRFIIAVWLIAMVSAIPFAIYTRLNYVEYPPDSGKESLDSAVCTMLRPDMPNFPLYELSFAIFFVVPMLVIVVFYTSMVLEIHKSVRNMSRTGHARTSAHWDSGQVQRRKTIVKMLSAVVVMFFVCWAPYHGQRFMYLYAQEVDDYRQINEVLYPTSGCLYYLSTTVNPILYTIMSTKYREAFKRVVCCCSRVQSSDSLMNGRRISPKNINLRRYAIDRPAEIFRFGSSRQVQAKDTRTSTDYGRGNEIIDDNCQNKPLLSAKHPIAGQQSSNESSSFQNDLKASLSTASSVV